jgi:aryl-alcohol dehydrogenase-like predicted oxidoreductase
VARNAAVAERHGLEPIAVYQGLWNLLCRDAEHEILPMCAEHAIGFVSAWSLAGGWLSGKYRRGAERPAGARLVNPDDDFLGIEPEIAYTAVDLLEEIGGAHGASVSQTALAWQLAHPWLTSALVGARRPEQLEENLGALNVQLRAEEMARLDGAFQPARRWPNWQIAIDRDARESDSF